MEFLLFLLLPEIRTGVEQRVKSLLRKYQTLVFFFSLLLCPKESVFRSN